MELREMNEESVAVDVWHPTVVIDEVEFPSDVYLGHAEWFVIHEDEEAVSLPEDTEDSQIPSRPDALAAGKG